ncbi:hypothetical protein [Kineococcus gypseus]|uniref:hypothetical protein n=1 Tax=Kineococcus gypseus TaxID=1637102 RepID=UPI003D7DBAA6
MSQSSVGMLAGLLLAVAAAVGGWPAFLLALLLGTLGFLAGAQLSGRLDLIGLVSSRGRG